MNTRAPLFAMIPYFGGGWSVQYAGDDSGTESRSGYGEFPASRFPGIPLVDCRTVQSFKDFPDHPREHYGNRASAGDRPTLTLFLSKAIACGATVTMAP